MRFAARLLSFILCFELIIGGYGPSIVMSSTALAGDCPAGTSMDATLNRCLTSNQVASIKMAVASCNTGTTEEQQKCYQNNAQSALDSQVNAGGAKNNNTNLGSKSPLLRVGTGAAIAVPLFLLTHNLFKKKSQRMVCKPASLMLMYAGAGVLLGGEVITYFSHKKKLKNMKDRWKEIATPKSDASGDSKRVQQTEAQSQAFEFLAQNEDSIAKTANTKFIYYASAAGLFAAGAVMAVVEKVKLTKALITINTSTDAAVKAAAQNEVNRITCSVSKEQANAAETKAKECIEAGGTSKNGICTTEAEKTAAAEKAETEKKEAAAKAEKERVDKMTPEEKAKYEKAKTAKVDKANEKLTEANNKKVEADNNLDKASDKLATMTDKDGKKLPNVKESDYQNAVDYKNEQQSIRNAATQTQKNAQTNYDNAVNGTTGSGTKGGGTQNSGGNNSGEQTKEGGGLAGKIATGALGQATSLIGGGNKGSNGTTTGSVTSGAQAGDVGGDDTSDQEACVTPHPVYKNRQGTWKSGACECPTGFVLNSQTGSCVTPDETSIESLRNYKLKRTAQYNLDNSTNAYELLELEKELENIEFENYSKLTNYDDIDVSQFKTYTFAGFTNKLISNLSPFGDAQALTCSETMPCPGGAECIDGSCGAAPANPAATTKPENTNQGIGEIIKGIFSNPFKSKTASAQDALKTTGDQVDKAIGKPLTRAAINAVFGTWIGIMSADFKEQANISKKRAEVLRGMKDEFASNDGITNCTEAERNSTAKSECFCYTSAGQRNTARANSSLCQKLWGTFNASSSDYLADNTKVCLDQNGNVDTACSCRNQKGADGKNTCMKASASNFSLTGLSTGSFKMLNAGTSAAQDLTNGILGAGQIDGAAAANNAMRIRKAADDMLKSGDPAAALAVKKLSDNIANSALKSTAGLSMGGGDSGSSLANMTPAQAVKSLDEELKKGTTQDITTAGSSQSVGGGNSEPEKLEFGMSQEDLAIQEDQIAEVMNKDLDMESADITKGSDTNLFEVLSNRYQRSGMRRLFDVDGKTKAEKPAESDISQ